MLRLMSPPSPHGNNESLLLLDWTLAAAAAASADAAELSSSKKEVDSLFKQLKVDVLALTASQSQINNLGRIEGQKSGSQCPLWLAAMPKPPNFNWTNRSKSSLFGDFNAVWNMQSNQLSN